MSIKLYLNKDELQKFREILQLVSEEKYNPTTNSSEFFGTLGGKDYSVILDYNKRFSWNTFIEEEEILICAFKKAPKLRRMFSNQKDLPKILRDTEKIGVR